MRFSITQELINFATWKFYNQHGFSKCNIKDEKDFEEKIKHDHPHLRKEEGDIEMDEVKK
jgi:hypothetical protein